MGTVKLNSSLLARKGTVWILISTKSKWKRNATKGIVGKTAT